MPKFIKISRVARATKSDKTQRTIFLRVFPSWENGKDFTFSTKITIPENRWNRITKSVLGSGIDSNRLNTQLSQLEAETQNIFQVFINRVPDASLKDLKSEIEFKLFNKGLGAKPELSLFDLFDKYIELKRSSLGAIRIKRYKFVQRCVNDFHKIRFGKKSIDVKDVNIEWRDGFKQFMMKRYDYGNSTINGYLKVVHAAVKYAYKTNYIDNFPFKDVDFDPEKSDIKYLTEDEYLSIANFDFSKSDQRIQRTADCFLFACHTGLAYSDLRSLKQSDLEKSSDGTISIVKTRSKTGIRFFVPINDFAKSIIEKYKNHQKIKGTDLLLPVIELGDYNQLLKMISLLCGIKKNLTSHVARHTFATTNWLNNGGTLESLQSMLGHNKIQTTEIYGQITNEKVKSEARMVFNNQSKKGALMP
jgi:site-specific recombinase XerD